MADVAHTFGLSADWLRSVMQVESGGDATARSPKGAIGLMQLMPSTYAGMQRKLGLGADPWRPTDNLLAGAGYLRRLTDRYGASGALAAYNAGPGRYERWLNGTATLPAETRAYVARVHARLQRGDRSAPGQAAERRPPDPSLASIFPALPLADGSFAAPPLTSSQPDLSTKLGAATPAPDPAINPIFAPIQAEAGLP